MESKKLELTYTSYVKFDELPAFWQELIKQAEEALPRAYAPYSKFHVGAAVKLSNGQIITGTNQENAAYPSGLCAERTAILYALSQYPEAKIEGLAVITSAKNKLCAPCGGCRQVMMDIELNRTGPYPIIFPGENGSWLLFQSVKDIFPFSFNL